MFMLSKTLQWFIAEEKQRTLVNLENGTVGRDQAIGSFTTLYQLAAAMNDAEAMKELSSAMARIRAGVPGLQQEAWLYSGRASNESAQDALY